MAASWALVATMGLLVVTLRLLVATVSCRHRRTLMTEIKESLKYCIVHTYFIDTHNSPSNEPTHRDSSHIGNDGCSIGSVVRQAPDDAVVVGEPDLHFRQGSCSIY